MANGSTLADKALMDPCVGLSMGARRIINDQLGPHREGTASQVTARTLFRLGTPRRMEAGCFESSAP